MVKNITYNISGKNVRVNNDSTDNSTNVVIDYHAVDESITKLREDILKSVGSPDQQKYALGLVNEIEQQFKSQAPNKTVLYKLISALPDAGNIASIGSFILSCLGV